MQLKEVLKARKGQTDMKFVYVGSLFAIVVIVLGMFAILSSRQGGVSIGGVTTVGGKETIQLAGAECTFAKSLADLSISSVRTDSTLSPPEDVYASTSAVTYNDGAYLPLANNTTSASGTLTLGSMLSCVNGKQDTFHVIFGDGLNYYQKDVGPVVANSSLVRLENIKLQLIGNVSLTVDNRSTFGADKVSAVVGNGETNSDIYLHVKELNASSYWGSTAYAVAFEFPTNNFSRVEVPGATRVGNPINISVASGSALMTWEVGKPLYHFAEDKLNVVVTAASGVNPGPGGTVNETNQANITCYVLDKATYIKNGVVLQAYESESFKDLGSKNFGKVCIGIV